MRAWLAISVLLSCFASILIGGEPPTLSRLFPAGGQLGTSVDVSFSGKVGDGDFTFWCSNPDLAWTKGADDNQLRVEISPDATPGVCYLRLITDFGVSDVKPFVVGAANEVLEKEPNDLLDEATRIASDPVLINGVLEKRGDVDHYQLPVSVGQTLIASIEAERGLKSEADVTLQLVDIKGNVLAQNLDYHGLDPQIVWTADSEQDVIVRVFGYPANPNSTIALGGGDNFLYRLQITKGPWCEGVLPLAVSSQQPTDLLTLGWNIPPESETVVPQQSQEHLNFSFIANGTPNSFFLPVTEHPIIVLSQHSEQSSDDSTLVTIPSVICGNIDRPYQIDACQFSAPKDSKWSFVLESRQLGYPLDAVLTLEETETGKQLARVDDVGREADSVIHWTSPADGTYRIKIEDVNGAATDNNLYRLWIRPQQPAVRTTVSRNSFVGKVGQPIEIAVKVERTFGFDKVVNFALESAIDGLTLENMASESKGDSSKEVKLKIVSEKPLVVPVRIVASTADADSQSHVVEELETGIVDLWIVFQAE